MIPCVLCIIVIDELEGGMRYKGLIRAPEFPKGSEWINTPRPLTIEGLRGKVVLLEFWTNG